MRNPLASMHIRPIAGRMVLGRAFARRGSLFVAATTVLALSAACSSGGAEESGSSESPVMIALGTEPTTLDPQLANDGNEKIVNDNIYESLVTRSMDGELEAGLAAELPAQVSPTTWEVKLRGDIEFQNGEPFDAEAAAFSIERMIDPEYQSDKVNLVETIVAADAVDGLTVQITTDAPDPILPARLEQLKMVPPEASKDEGFASNPIGTGPYKFVEWKRGSEIQLEAYDDYWGEGGEVESAVFRFIGDSGARLSGMLSGELDLITNLSPENSEQVPQVVTAQGSEHPVVILNTVDGITADLEVRKALNYAIDKQTLIDSLFGGYAVLDDCQIAGPAFAGYNDSLEPYAYDPAQAKSMIEEAGVAGETIRLVGTTGRWLRDRELVEAIGGYWEAAGLKVQVDIIEFNEYLNTLFDRKARPDSIYVSSGGSLLDIESALGAEYSMKGSEASNDDAAMHALIEQAGSEMDPAKRQELNNQITQRACDGAYFAFLLNNQDIYGLSDRIQWEPRVDADILLSTMTYGSK